MDGCLTPISAFGVLMPCNHLHLITFIIQYIRHLSSLWKSPSILLEQQSIRPTLTKLEPFGGDNEEDDEDENEDKNEDDDDEYNNANIEKVINRNMVQTPFLATIKLQGKVAVITVLHLID